ncbi:gluconate 2-dehydrogenase subunit 3 family protein [Fibrella forsythiae]|uniref:Gluconate 2-dehydrogenase subunit 3 family protein n=1 Tax=Fibrella forsythiae TaxID=2817061 RepID=A0ABS3JCH2_9BACT|nr:gluconate 2-dehydrogenase subunit 3 family protein [Fibrella forsythiae]MBO0947694.1 gluconate 2-dehydrogenase subunit 3 family protein [Fibrella forsythiae]
MQRRTALRGLTMALGGLVSLPAWATGWTPESIGPVSIGSVDDETLLGEIVETIIPETTTPGAKSLKVHQFAMRMIQDCYGEPAQTALKQGTVLTESTAQQLFTKSFADCDASQRKAVLNAVATSTDPAGKAFVNLIKRLTIQGYTNSEFYLVNVQKFNMAPGYYHGCIPVEKLTAAGSR